MHNKNDQLFLTVVITFRYGRVDWAFRLIAICLGVQKGFARESLLMVKYLPSESMDSEKHLADENTITQENENAEKFLLRTRIN